MEGGGSVHHLKKWVIHIGMYVFTYQEVLAYSLIGTHIYTYIGSTSILPDRYTHIYLYREY